MTDEDKDKKEEVVEKKETIEDVVREAHEEETKEEATEEVKEEPVKEEVKEEPKEEEPEVDAQEVADAAEKKGREEVKAEILNALGVTSEQKEEAEEAGWKSPWEKRGETRPANWQEAVEAGADLAEFRRAEQEKQVKAEENKQEEQRAKTREELNKYWDRQLDELRGAGQLPAIDDKVAAKIKSGKALTEEDRKDPGLIAQRDLFNKMHEVGQQRSAAAQDVIYNLKEIYYEHYKAPETRQPAGADAPVSGGQKSPVQPQSEELDYNRDIRGKSIEEIIRGE